MKILHPEYYQAYTRLIQKVQPTHGLEIGFCWGESAAAFLRYSEGDLTSVDTGDWYNLSLEFVNHFGVDKIKFVWGESPEILKTINDNFDFIYIDADHSYESVSADIKGCLPKLRSNGVIAFDDYKRLSITPTGKPFGVERACKDNLPSDFLPIFEDTFIKAFRKPLI